MIGFKVFVPSSTATTIPEDDLEDPDADPTPRPSGTKTPETGSTVTASNSSGDDANIPIPEGTPQRITAIGREYVGFALREPGIFRLKFGGFTDGLDDEARVRSSSVTSGSWFRKLQSTPCALRARSRS